MLNPARRFSRLLIVRADAARDEGRFDAAATLYEEALRLRPDHAGLHVQCGNMLKETGRFAEAEQHYRAAEALRPGDADVPLQLGHLFKIGGRPADARREYTRALGLQPGSAAAQRELAMLADHLHDHGAEARGHADASSRRWTVEELGRLVPELAPRPLRDMLVEHDERIEVRRLGRTEEGFWGARRTVRGVEAVHGLLLSRTPIVSVQVLVNGVQLLRGPVLGGYPLAFEVDPRRTRKYVYNHWVDFSAFGHGLHAVELRFRDAEGGLRSWHDQVVIAEPVAEQCYPDSDFLVAPRAGDARSIEEQVRSRPSQVHEARRALFPDGIRNVLVLRTDQLGDMVASIPAMRRLRALLPDARLVGVMTAANAELARTLVDLFDEVIAIDFPDDPLEQRRTMKLEEQEALRALLAPYRFDIAMDLARADVSRALLRLSGARFLYGVGGDEFPFLSGNFVFNTHDRWTGHDMAPHSTKVLALVEALGTIIGSPAPIARRGDLSRALLERHGIGRDDRYVVLHMGARIGFSRWPHFARLAQMLLAQTDLRIVAISEDAQVRRDMSADLLADPRFVLIDRRLPFDEFDAILSFAEVLVGNDSGPKHLASLRGTKVVTIFSARINWTEWGQENVGVIVSRKVPCAGCAILHEPENCGKGFACIVDIRPEEILAQVMRLSGAAEDRAA